MDCLIKHSLSFVVESMVKKLIDDVNSYAHLLTTEDWRLLVSLDNAVVDRQMCERKCLGCLEFVRMMNMLFGFNKGILDANKENEFIFIELCRVFNIFGKCNPIILALEFVVSPGYVRSKIKSSYVAGYDKYVDAVKSEITRLALDHYYHEQAKCDDTIQSYGDLGREQVIAYELIDRSDREELFYVDQNVISEYGNNQNFRRQIENFKNKVGCKFVYSPYVIEDGVKMSRVRLAEYFDVIEKLTDSTMLVRAGEKVVLAREDIKITFDRVLLWRNATRAAEDSKINKMYLNHWGHPYYSRGAPLSVRANKNIQDFLDSLRPYMDDERSVVDFNDYESDRVLCRKLSAATIQKSFSLEELVDRTIKYKDDMECMRHIEHLCDFLDLINYKTEPLAELSKIRSSLQDTEHLKNAWKADYFVTEDQRLRARGEFIYSVLGLGTRFISINELKGKIFNEFKK